MFFSLQRLALSEKRLIEFNDLIEVTTRGTIECDESPESNAEYLRMVAIHEAGHAAIALIDSAGSNIPEYLSIVPSQRYSGVSADSIAYRFSQANYNSYAHMRHQARVMLAGRVAEELVFGAELVSSGAAEDLRKVTQLVSNAFANYGFAPDMEVPGQSSSNLAVVIGEPTASEYAHVEKLVRAFLAKQYCLVKEALVAHRPLYDEIVEHLVVHKVVHQNALLAIAAKHIDIKTAERC